MRTILAFLVLLGSASIATRAGAAPEFVGSAVCASCHARQHAAWLGSQHRLAMQEANEKTVLGDFRNARFRHAGVTSTFSRRDGRFVVETEGPDGKIHEYVVRYTFGIEPLQQYLVELPDGRMQALSIAWDAPRKRWFHLYPKGRIGPTDELHWTGPAFNWNAMCADCHSTALRKNYDAASNRFHTRWSEVSVGCEACHGPGSAHLAWANEKASADASKGLAAQLGERSGVTWTLAPNAVTATRSRPRDSDREIQVCAQCHSRRGQIADGYTAGQPFLDYYRPAWLVAPLYYADGQQRDEVYDWGSFLQSRMYAAGVTCSDCHEPHGGKLRAAGNAVCTQCHAAGQFDTAQHHHHAAGSQGAQCAGCHMPTVTYMVVDPRHDHSLRIPRPDLSVTLGTPNACNGCHANRDARWAAAQVKAWYGHDPKGFQTYASSFAAAETGAVGASALLRAIANDGSEPALVRASAIATMPVTNRAALETVASGVRSTDPLIRLGALQALTETPPDVRARLAAPLLSDPFRAVRIDAASVLADLPLKGADERAAFERAAREYVDSQKFNADRADARTNLGSFLARRGDVAAGERELRAAIELDRTFVPAYVNLADLYRASGRDADAVKILREGLVRLPKAAALHHAFGLTLVRLKQYGNAQDELARAAALDPANARFAYVYAIALNSAGRRDQALAVLTKTSATHPADIEVLQALAAIHKERGDDATAQRYAERARAVAEAELR